MLTGDREFQLLVFGAKCTTRMLEKSHMPKEESRND